MTALRATGLLIRWELLRLRPIAIPVIAAQVLLGTASMLGLALFAPNLDDRSAAFLATGGPTVALITVGLNLVPANVAHGRTSGLYDYLQSFPTPRLSPVIAQAVVLCAAAIPGAAVTALVGAYRFDLNLHLSAALAVAVLLAALTATALGFAVAVVVSIPQAVNLISSILLIGAMLFAPVNYPAERLPEWAASLHSFLPFEAMATSIRTALIDGTMATEPTLRLAAWAAGSLATTAVLIGRRG